MAVAKPKAQARNSLEHLLAELRRINNLLNWRIQELQIDQQAAENEFRGLYVTEEEVVDLLNDPDTFLAGSYEADIEADTAHLEADSRLRKLQAAFKLSPLELDVLLIALAPEVDLRYERLFIFLQDDVTRRRPSVDLALRLLCPGLAAKLMARKVFYSEGPLIKNLLLEVSEENAQRQPSLLSRTFKLDESVTGYLLGHNRLSSALSNLTQLIVEPHANLLSEEGQDYGQRLLELVQTPQREETGGTVCVLVGPDEIAKQDMAGAVCQKLQRPLILIDCNLLLNASNIPNLLRLLGRDSRMLNATLFWQGFEALSREEAPAPEVRRLVTRFLSEFEGLSIVSSLSPQPALVGYPHQEFHLYLEAPGYGERQRLWEAQLGNDAAGLDLESLASRFRMRSGQIFAATATAYSMAYWRGERSPGLADLEAACRSHSNQRLTTMARKITPRYQWKDLVLAADQFSMLKEMCEQVRYRAHVYERWGFDKKIALGKGLNSIFAGPSGTGKTMSSEIIANDLGMDLYKINLSTIVSKYIGETEKNLERIFNEAGDSNAILFFDEADSIFGKRSEVKDAHDRYANIETGYLLQKMEEYDGIVILATNLLKNMDDAFMRRMHFVLEFPFPEETDRLLIWRKSFPDVVPLAEDVDLPFMARQFKIAGGNIKNVALSAAFMAAADTSHDEVPAVHMAHLVRATKREYQKMGKLCTKSDFGPYYHLVGESF